VHERKLTAEQVLSLLAEAPLRIEAATSGLSPAQLRTAPGSDEWSANEVLAHLRACADMWGQCIMRMLAEDRPTLRAINPRTWIKRTDYLELDFRASFDSYALQRADLLAILEPLPNEAWSRAATVTGAGRVLQRTVWTYAHGLAIHERPHVKQIARVVTALRV
jgi:hypothetical protein